MTGPQSSSMAPTDFPRRAQAVERYPRSGPMLHHNASSLQAVERPQSPSNMASTRRYPRSRPMMHQNSTDLWESSSLSARNLHFGEELVPNAPGNLYQLVRAAREGAVAESEHLRQPAGLRFLRRAPGEGSAFQPLNPMTTCGAKSSKAHPW